MGRGYKSFSWLPTGHKMMTPLYSRGHKFIHSFYNSTGMSDRIKNLGVTASNTIMDRAENTLKRKLGEM